MSVFPQNMPLNGQTPSAKTALLSRGLRRAVAVRSMPRAQRGAASMLTVLMVLGSLGLLVMSLSQSTRFSEAASRGERDQVAAAAAAEAAIFAARQDILYSSRKIQCRSKSSFPAGCGTGADVGLCGPTANGVPGWLSTDITNPQSQYTAAVGVYGSTTIFPTTGKALTPAVQPRYVIEAIDDLGTENAYIASEGSVSEANAVIYRITGIGFGPGGSGSGEQTSVVLQSLYRPPVADCSGS